jgi:hypothetical protein
VFIQATDPMNGFDITLLAPHAFLVPVGVDLTGTIIGTPTIPPVVLAECFQGVLKGGTVCQSSDTIDTLHLAAVAATGALPLGTVGGNGLLFTAIYQIVGSAPAGTVIGYQTNANDGLTNCTATSVPGTCINIANGTVIPVPETVQTGFFTGSSTQPFLQLSPVSTALGNTFPGLAIPAQTVTTTDNGGWGAFMNNGGAPFNGDTTASYSVTVTPPTSSATGLTASISPTPLDFALVAAGGSLTNMLSFSNGAMTTSGLWTITVTMIYHFDSSCVPSVGCSGPASTLSESITYTVNIEDFGYNVGGLTGGALFLPFWCPAAGQGSACPAGQSGSATISVTPNGYAGTVTLANTTPSPVTSPILVASVNPTSVLGASGTAMATFSGGLLRPTLITGSYTVAVTAMGTLAANGAFAAQTKVKSVSVIVRPQDFSFNASSGTPTGPGISYASGGSATDLTALGSRPFGTTAINTAGFAGPVTFSSVIQGGTGLTVGFATNPVILTAGQKLTDLVTFGGTAATTTTFSVTITGTATLASSTPSTQMHSVTYSVTITVPIIIHPTSTSVNCVPSSVTVNVGTSCTATVTDTSSSGATTPTGSVSFLSSGTGTFSSSGSCNLVAGVTGTAICSVTYTPTVVGTGTHTITGSYGGDPTHAATQGTFGVTVTQPVAVTITTTLSSTPITVGGSVTDSAVLSGNTATAGGTVTYRFFTGSICSGTGTVVGSPVAVIALRLKHSILQDLSVGTQSTAETPTTVLRQALVKS